MDVIDKAKAAIKGKKRRIVFPEGEDARIVEAAEKLRHADLAEPVVLGGRLPQVGPGHIAEVLKLRPAMTTAMAERLLSRPLHFGAAMVGAGEATAMIAGAANPTGRVIEAGLMGVGLAPGISIPSSFFLMQWPDRCLLFADCAVNVDPSSSHLADIAVAAARSAKKLFVEPPRVALLSFSTHGSSREPKARLVAEATILARERAPGVAFDGELQADSAIVPAVAARKVRRESPVAGHANVLVFPDLNAGNIAYKLTQYLGGAKAVGPLLQGFRRPLSDISRGASVEDIVATAALLLFMA